MNQVKLAIAAIGVAFALCRGQSVHISGRVQNSAGAGIPGVTVRLGKAGLATTTDSDGGFTLSGSVSGIGKPASHTASGEAYPFRMIGNGILFSVMKRTRVGIQMHDCGGRRLASREKIVSPDDGLIPLLRLSDGVHIYRIATDDHEYTFRGMTGIAAPGGPMPIEGGTALAKGAQRAVAIEDALLAAKEGFQLSRIPVTNPDTSGLQVILAPWVTGTMADLDGNIYRTIRYGSQVWMAENLRTSKYNDGTAIPLVTDSAAWGAMETPAYSFFDYTTDPVEQGKWGAFYNGHAVSTGKLAPAGWHVPADAEWDTLENYLVAGGYDYDGTASENKIAKSMAAKSGWLPSADSGAIGNDTLGNDASGFSGMPNGYCDYAGETYYRNWYAFWWTSTQRDENFMKLRGIYYHASGLKSDAFTKVYGLSVRLVKDK